MKDRAEFLKRQMRVSGENPSVEAVAEMLGSLNPEAFRRVAYAVLDEVAAGNTMRLVEFPKFGPQGELFR